MPFKKFSLSSGKTGFEENILDKYEDRISSHYHDTSDEKDNFVGSQRSNPRQEMKNSKSTHRPKLSNKNSSSTNSDFTFTSSTKHLPINQESNTRADTITDNSSSSSYVTSTSALNVTPCFYLSSEGTHSSNQNTITKEKNETQSTDEIESGWFSSSSPSSTNFTLSTSSPANSDSTSMTSSSTLTSSSSTTSPSITSTSTSTSTTSTASTTSTTSTSSQSGGQSSTSSSTSQTSNEELSLTQLQDDYTPRIFQIPQNATNLLDMAIKAKFKSTLPFPQFTLGFQHFIHQSKNNFQKANIFSGRTKPYLVLNKFENQIDDYNSGLEQLSLVYFKLENKPNIINRSFYKLWELLLTFNLINNEEKNFTSAHLAEAPGSFIQATMFYRDKYCNKNNCKDDQYIITSVFPETPNKYIKSIDQSIITYSKEKSPRVFIFPTTNKTEADKSSTKSNGDLTNLKDIKLFVKYFQDTSKSKANLVTADGVVEWSDRNLQEQEITPLIFGEIYTAISILANKGNFVCKIFETYTDVSTKIIYLLNSIFTNVYIAKPLMSRKSSSEKFLVCIGFKEELRTKTLKVLEEILLGLETESKKNYYLNDIFIDFQLPLLFRGVIINANIEIANKQFQAINEIIVFIEEQNYRGDEYIKRRTMQISATKFWINIFYPIPDKLKDQIKKIQNLKEEIVNMNNGKTDVLLKKIKY